MYFVQKGRTIFGNGQKHIDTRLEIDVLQSTFTIIIRNISAEYDIRCGQTNSFSGMYAENTGTSLEAERKRQRKITAFLMGYPTVSNKRLQATTYDNFELKINQTKVLVHNSMEIAYV